MKYLILPVVFALGFVIAHAMPPSTAADPQKGEPKTPAKPVKVVDRFKQLEELVANPSIDMEGYLKIAQEAEKHRQTRRVTEEEFIKMSQEEGTIVLDARSKEMFDLLHVKGAVNLSFPNIDTESLPRVLPDKKARILIYCNNNFTAAGQPGQPGRPGGVSVPASATGPDAKASELVNLAQRAFMSKAKTASLNISTYIALYNYGYRNVYELGPLLNPGKTKIPFASNTTKLK